jgi:hypothetical protein
MPEQERVDDMKNILSILSNQKQKKGAKSFDLTTSDFDLLSIITKIKNSDEIDLTDIEYEI